jgi:hypothetical protein
MAGIILKADHCSGRESAMARNHIKRICIFSAIAALAVLLFAGCGVVLQSVEKDESGTSAIVTHEFEMKLLRDVEELERRRVERSEAWEKMDRVWYLRRTDERVAEVLEPWPRGFLTP